ncbi:hypothetical protein [Streptomyces sp. G45]|uniref:hypothetical protein n=1 Tax=Streptomyces sp. G45 TaxID=3406627 RepID=UPI003C1491CC
MGGWFRDENGVERWRDGRGWTRHTRDMWGNAGESSPPAQAPKEGPLWGFDPTLGAPPDRPSGSPQPTFDWGGTSGRADPAPPPSASGSADLDTVGGCCGCLVLLCALAFIAFVIVKSG